jgi:hypothetical protein
VRIFHEAMRSPNKSGDQFWTPLVHNIVMRRLTRVPQLKASSQEVTNGEDCKPLGSDETLRGDRLPAEATDLDEHGDAEEAVDDRVLLGGLGEENWIEIVTSLERAQHRRAGVRLYAIFAWAWVTSRPPS